MSEAIELHVTIPQNCTGGGQKAKSKAVAAGEEVIYGLSWVCGSQHTWKSVRIWAGRGACSDAYRDRIRHSRQPNRV